MGFGLLFWSWLAFSLPVQQENVALSIQKEITVASSLKGIASFYHQKFVGRPTATGETFSNDDFTAASNYFSLGTFVKVTNLKDGASIFVRINDRMGQPGRLIDLTKRAAIALHFKSRGLTTVLVMPVPTLIGKQAILAQREGDDASVPDNAL